MTENKDDGKVLLVDKPKTWTSFDVVKKLRFALNLKKIGHAGTLDPLATGLLILCTGKMTKQIESYQALEKEYTGEIVIGKTTPSYDLETEVEHVTDTDHITDEDLINAAEKFIGKIEQVPPQFSAIKVGGKRAYKSARKGEKIELKARPVEISAFEVERLSADRIAFRVICSKGTYIRSLAHDFGQELGTGAYLGALRRTRIGTFNVDDAQTIEEIISG
ncbi:MAG: tRNA pseudouridine(55) synthase TruB [Cyclobacteriaceae bacterium]